MAQVIIRPGAGRLWEAGLNANFTDLYNRVDALEQGVIRLEAWAENTTPGTTDMTAALQSAVEYAASLHSTVGFSVPIDLGGVSVGISDQGAYGIDVRGLSGVKIQNGELKAIGTWTGTTPLIYAGANVSRTEEFTVENVHFECDHKAAGILFDNAVGCAVVDVVMTHIEGYGLRTQTKSGQLRIARTTIRQYIWGETGFDDQANRTAIAFDMNTADWIMESCIAYVCAIPFYKGTGTNWQMDSCHFYNDGLTTVTDADAIYNCKIDDPRGGQITNLYSDKGIIYINCDYLEGSGYDHLYIDGVTGVSGGQNTKDFILYTEVANNNLGGLSLSNINLPIRATNFDFQTGGSGSYASQLRWSFIGVKQKDGTKVSGVADMFNMNGQFRTDGGGNFYFGGFQDVVLKSERKIALMADYDANSSSADRIVEFGWGTTVYTQQISSGRWNFGVGQATGGGPIVQLGWSGDDFWLAPTNASGGIDYTKGVKFDQSAGVWEAETPFKALTTTVSGLPAAGTAGAGARAVVTDATATTFASTVTGGGANTVPVYSDGTNWLIG